MAGQEFFGQTQNVYYGVGAMTRRIDNTWIERRHVMAKLRVRFSGVDVSELQEMLGIEDEWLTPDPVQELVDLHRAQPKRRKQGKGIDR